MQNRETIYSEGMGNLVEGFITDTEVVEVPKVESHNSLTEVKEEISKERTLDIPTVREISLNDFEFRQQGFYLNELWDNSYNLHARITKITKERVTCECVVDKENKLFETRSFPALLFKHLRKNQVGNPVIVSIKTRPGSTRIDIRDGKNIVNLSIFDLKDGWNNLINSGLDKPISFKHDSSDL